MVPFTAAKSDGSRSSLSGYYDEPNYMSHTKSSRAKVRSLNAPGGRRRSVTVLEALLVAVGEPKKASYEGTQVSREVVMAPEFFEEIDASMRTVLFTVAKNDSSRRCLSGNSDHPNYMLHTHSSRGKVRSLSAPGGRRRLKYSNVQQNDDQCREVVSEPKKASYRGR
nr:hypothetical protein [Tanacetum cinerariifolium]